MFVAITGIILILFVVGHLLGNLQIFLGPDWINGYSQHLRDLGPLLWLIRIFLLVTVIVHIYVTIRLAIDNRRARPEADDHCRHDQAGGFLLGRPQPRRVEGPGGRGWSPHAL